MTTELLTGDCLEVLPTLDAESIDAIVTDPPYGIGFMGHEWDQPGQDHGPLRKGPGHSPGHPREREARRFVGDHTQTTARATSMEAGRYDLSITANRRYQGWCEAWAAELLRVAKPGAHLLVFGSTRTSHRLTAGLEDAGWEIRDTLVWAYASGFPKSLDVSKAIDRMDAALERLARARRSQSWFRERLSPQQVDAATGSHMGHHLTTHPTQPFVPTPEMLDQLRPLIDPPPDWLEELVRERAVESANFAARELLRERPGTSAPGVAGEIHRGGTPTTIQDTAPATPEAEQWAGWGTALKPAWEPVILARKPLQGTVATNVLAHGTGALNIDGTRIPAGPGDIREGSGAPVLSRRGEGPAPERVVSDPDIGRWPANVVLTDPIFDGDVDGVIGGGEQSGGGNPAWRSEEASAKTYGGYETGDPAGYTTGKVPVDTDGTYSRFFLVPKASRSDREPILGGHGLGAEDQTMGDGANGHDPARPILRANSHPTVKPLELMRHLVRLVTPPGGTVLDPFLGSGTTALAAELEGFGWVGIEREPQYVAIAQARLEGAQRGLGLDVAAPTTRRGRAGPRRTARPTADQTELIEEAAP